MPEKQYEFDEATIAALCDLGAVLKDITQRLVREAVLAELPGEPRADEAPR